MSTIDEGVWLALCVLALKDIFARFYAKMQNASLNPKITNCSHLQCEAPLFIKQFGKSFAAGKAQIDKMYTRNVYIGKIE